MRGDSFLLKKVIDDNVELNRDEILPIAIDYACGTGHFLTEYMDIIQKIINEYDTTYLKRSTKNCLEK